MQSEGEYRVGSSFDPSSMGLVDDIKAAAAALIDVIDGIETGLNAPSVLTTECGQARARLKALAMTAAEEAAMWAVKAATKGDRS